MLATVATVATVTTVATEERDARAFVLASTRLQRPPRVPELELHLADSISDLWQRTAAEHGERGVDPPYWAFAWAGGQAVARHLLDVPAEVAGCSVLDLATGSGLCGLAALRSGAADVLAVDIDPLSRAAATLNAEAAGVTDLLTARTVDLLDAAPPAVDVLLAGDVCYDPDMSARVLPWLRAAHDAGTRVLLGDPGRAYLPSAGLVRIAEYDVPTTSDLEGREVVPAAVYTFAAGQRIPVSSSRSAVDVRPADTATAAEASDRRPSTPRARSV